MTKEEKFLLAIYSTIKETKPKEGIVDALALSKQLGMNEFQLKQFLRALGQSNFIKKYGEYEVGLTENGARLAEELY